MSLKDKLRSLIEATFTSKKTYIAEQASPQSTANSTVECIKGDWGHLTAPIDGYANIFASSGTTAANIFIQSADRKIRFGTASSGDAGLVVAVKKGDAIHYWIDDLFGNCSISYFKRIGGGYLSSLVKSLCGGGLCLLSHLSKRFLNLSLIGQAQRNKLAIKCLRQQELIGTRRLFLRLTDLRQCISLAWFNPFTSQTSKLPEAFLRSLGIHSLAQFIRNTLLLLEKAKYFVSAFMRTKAGLQLSILPHGSARLSFCEGGAL